MVDEEVQGADSGQGTDIQEPQGQASQEDSLYSEILNSIEDQTQKALLEPHLKSWDAKVTQKFQGIHDEYKPYKELGSLPDLQRAVQAFQILQQNPQAVYQILHEQFGRQQPQQVQAQQVQPSSQADDPYAEFDPAVAEYLRRNDEKSGQLEKAVQLMSNMMTKQLRTAQEQQEDLQLDTYMGELKTKLGDFDEVYVLTRMQNGLDGEMAVREYQSIVNRGTQVQQQTNQSTPVVLNGSGGVAAGKPFDPKTAPRNELTNLVAQIMAQSNE